jgi:AcrR family transcriptional regulator
MGKKKTKRYIMTAGYYHRSEENMGIQERRERERAERKALIMRCTKELIIERGTEGVSMQDIAEKAELSKATLYLYVPNKEELFREICIESADHFTKYFQARIRPGLSALDMLKLYWKSYVDLFGKSSESSDLSMIFNMRRYLAPEFPFISIEENSDPVTGSDSQFFSLIKDMIEQGITEGIFEADTNTPLISHTVLSLFSLIMENAAKYSASSGRADTTLMGVMKSIFQIILRGIAREGVDRSLLVLDIGAAKDVV